MDFDDFVGFVFREQDSSGEWYFADNYSDPEITREQFVHFANSSFQNIEKIAEGRSNSAVYMGLNFLINGSCSDFPYGYFDVDIPFNCRGAAVENMQNVFKVLFSKMENKPFTSDMSREVEPCLEWLCYMWWDILPRHGVPFRSELKDIDNLIVLTLGRVLALEHLACKESALHGLAHWCSAQPELVGRILESAEDTIPIELRSFFADAKKGNLA